MNVLVVYDSVFGNTDEIAQAIGNCIEGTNGTHARVETLPVSQVTPDKLIGLDMLIVGSPTRSFRPTNKIVEMLNRLSKGSLSGMRVASFDTRMALEVLNSPVLRLVVDKGGYAADTIAKELKKKGGNLVAPPEGFLVTGEEGPLKAGEIERAREWAQAIIIAT